MSAKKVTIRKLTLDERVSILFDRDRKEISAITDAFLEEISRHLLDQEEVYLPGFGTFKVSVRSGKRLPQAALVRGNKNRGSTGEQMLVVVRKKYYVTFRRGRSLKDRFLARFGSAGKVVEHEHDQVRRG